MNINTAQHNRDTSEPASVHETDARDPVHELHDSIDWEAGDKIVTTINEIEAMVAEEGFQEVKGVFLTKLSPGLAHLSGELVDNIILRAQDRICKRLLEAEK